ncbi:hypothetical protein T08_606 [Trichinella sp. T8]|nr:hypothetical protein T08_606 [Trichinella sp. T8]
MKCINVKQDFSYKQQTSSTYANDLVVVIPWLSLKAAAVDNLPLVDFPFVLKSPLPTYVM